MHNPYDGLPPTAFWRSGVADPAPDLSGLYTKRWTIAPGDAIATGGSCFAQHLSRHLRSHGFNVLDAEPAPAGLPRSLHETFGYSLYSARYGNITTVQQLLQLAREALGEVTPEPVAWERDGRFFDAFRPGVEPDGLPSAEDVALHRANHLRHVRQVFVDMDVFVFTLGLTEHWALKGADVVFPMAPGTIAGSFDPAVHEFRNASFGDVVGNFAAFDALLARHRYPARPVRHLLTVSPVPLTGTFSGMHVLAATAYSKAVLRAAAGELVRTIPNVDYFPAFEIVTNPAARGTHFASNLRSVRAAAVATVMEAFFDQHTGAAASAAAAAPAPAPAGATDADDDMECEEAILDAFGGR